MVADDPNRPPPAPRETTFVGAPEIRRKLQTARTDLTAAVARWTERAAAQTAAVAALSASRADLITLAVELGMTQRDARKAMPRPPWLAKAPGETDEKE